MFYVLYETLARRRSTEVLAAIIRSTGLPVEASSNWFVTSKKCSDQARSALRRVDLLDRWYDRVRNGETLNRWPPGIARSNTVWRRIVRERETQFANGRRAPTAASSFARHPVVSPAS
jgi:hypothetical protein